MTYHHLLKRGAHQTADLGAVLRRLLICSSPHYTIDPAHSHSIPATGVAEFHELILDTINNGSIFPVALDVASVGAMCGQLSTGQVNVVRGRVNLKLQPCPNGEVPPDSLSGKCERCKAGDSLHASGTQMLLIPA